MQAKCKFAPYIHIKEKRKMKNEKSKDFYILLFSFFSLLFLLNMGA